MDWLGSLQREMGKLGYKPREIDELELWECAIALGVEDSYSHTEKLDSRTLLKRRVAADRQGKRLRWGDLET